MQNQLPHLIEGQEKGISSWLRAVVLFVPSATLHPCEPAYDLGLTTREAEEPVGDETYMDKTLLKSKMQDVDRRYHVRHVCGCHRRRVREEMLQRSCRRGKGNPQGMEFTKITVLASVSKLSGRQNLAGVRTGGTMLRESRSSKYVEWVQVLLWMQCQGRGISRSGRASSWLVVEPTSLAPWSRRTARRCYRRLISRGPVRSPQ